MNDSPSPPDDDGPDDSQSESNGKRCFNLAERTALFGETVVKFCVKLKVPYVAQPLVRQLVRSATSIGANYVEADEAGSRAEFRYRIGLCKREARETKFNLRMVVAAKDDARKPARVFWKEADELVRIFASILRNTPEE
jgi:four helix bundle protein